MSLKNMLTNELFERWQRGDRFHLLYMNDSDMKNIFIGTYDDCHEAVRRRYGLDHWPANFLLVDITEDLIEHMTNFLVKSEQHGLVH